MPRLKWPLFGAPALDPAPVQLGASAPEQLRENVAALQRLDFTADELARIDQYAQDGKLNLWEKPSTDQRV